MRLFFPKIVVSCLALYVRGNQAAMTDMEAGKFDLTGTSTKKIGAEGMPQSLQQTARKSSDVIMPPMLAAAESVSVKIIEKIINDTALVTMADLDAIECSVQTQRLLRAGADINNDGVVSCAEEQAFWSKGEPVESFLEVSSDAEESSTTASSVGRTGDKENKPARRYWPGWSQPSLERGRGFDCYGRCPADQKPAPEETPTHLAGVSKFISDTWPGFSSPQPPFDAWGA
ncbi:unnamed protein product [Amoebophrya sp. A120]|nr:unnamed protein product [Amoebophrya sp. A120]|eukprot:GSA120T00001677001.1